MTHYFTGTPCKRGHIVTRLVSDRSCTECNRLKRAMYYAQNPEKYRKKRREKYAEDPTKEKKAAVIRSAEWRRMNPNHEGDKQAKKAYKNSFVGRVKMISNLAKRRAAKLQRTPAWLSEDDLWLIEEVYALAKLRTDIFGFSWHVDHIVPLQGKTVSGLHVPLNLRVIPWKDNVAKGSKWSPLV